MVGLLWPALALGSVLFGLMMLRNGSVRRWPMLFCYVSLVATQYLICAPILCLLPHYYARAYYPTAFALEGCQFLMMLELVTAVVGITPWLRKMVRGFVVTVGGVMVLATLLIGVARFDNIINAARNVDLVICLAWCGTLLVVLCSSKAVAEFSGGMRGIACGFLLQVTGDQVCTASAMYLPNAAWIDFARSAVYAATLVTWGISLQLVMPFSLDMRNPYRGPNDATDI